jgi:hypothetical protein
MRREEGGEGDQDEGGEDEGGEDEGAAQIPRIGSSNFLAVRL